MYRGAWARSLISRAVAVFVVCLVLTLLAGLVAEAERELIKKMSHDELRSYVSEGAGTSYAERCAVILFIAAVFVGVVEALAGGSRLMIAAARDSNPHTR